MLSLPVDGMNSPTNTYQIAGLDDLGRGFNRQVDMQVLNGTFQAVFRYERFLLETEPHATEPAALAMLITQLQGRGYTQLRSRLQFRDGAYLGSQEPWEEHPDPVTRGFLTQFLRTIRTIFRRG